MASRSLGTLTIDLVARTGGFVQGMTKAERESKKWRRQVERDLKAVGRTAGIAAGAVVAGLTAMVASSIKNADQSRKTAQAVGLTTEAYTGLSFAASQSGVATAELNAGLGRLNRSILEAAGGTKQYADSFDALGVQVIDAEGKIRRTEDVLGDIADRFQSLPDGVEKSALAMELLGRSGAKLIPLLNGGSEGIDKLTRQAEALGLVISDETARQAELFNDSLAVMSGAAKGVSNQLAAELLPTISTLAAGFADVASQGALVPAVAEKISNSLKAVTKVAIGAAAAFDVTGRRIGGMAAIIASIPDGFSAVARTFNEVKGDLSATVLEYAELLDTISNAGTGAGGEAAKAQVADLAAILRSLRGESETAGKVAEKLSDSVRTQVEALELQAQTLGMSSSALQLMKLRADGATEAQLASAAAALEQVDAFKKMEEINAEALSIAEGLKDQETLIRESYERRRQIVLDNTAITGEAQRNLLLALEQKQQEELLDLNAGFWERYLEATQDNLLTLDQITANTLSSISGKFGDALESIVFDFESLEDAGKKVFESILRSVVNALGQMAAQWVAYQAVQLLVGKTTQISGAAQLTANALAAQQLAALNAFASTAAIPVVGPPAAPAAAAAALAATAPFVTATAAAALSGIAHDGIDSVPTTGTWLLEKGERVTTAETSAKLDRTLDEIRRGSGGVVVNLHADKSRAGTVEQRQTDDGRTEVDIFVSDILGDGPRSRVIQNAFGLRRVGR